MNHLSAQERNSLFTKIFYAHPSSRTEVFEELMFGDVRGVRDVRNINFHPSNSFFYLSPSHPFHPSHPSCPFPPSHLLHPSHPFYPFNPFKPFPFSYSDNRFVNMKFDYVQKKMTAILESSVLKKKILEKTIFCTIKNCKQNDCSYAHSMEEYQPPICLQQEFCLDNSCIKNHGFTKQEYIELYNIKKPVPKEVSLDKTQLCGIMKVNKPCHVEGCTFAHSVHEIKPIPCFKDGNCKREDCKLKHSRETFDDYLVKQKIQKKEWNMRPASLNSYEAHLLKRNEREKEDEEFIKELQEDEEKLRKNLELQKESKEDEEEDEEDEVIFIIDQDVLKRENEKSQKKREEKEKAKLDEEKEKTEEKEKAKLEEEKQKEEKEKAKSLGIKLAREVARKNSVKLDWDDEDDIDFSVKLVLNDDMDLSEDEE
jgi:hypothetical protein